MVALDQFMQLAMQRTVPGTEMQDGRSVEQTGQVERRVFDQQVHIKRKGFADRFSTGKGQDFERRRQTGYIQTK
ncbi:hypothetical protein D3C73_1253630 [compost metagenome]